MALSSNATTTSGTLSDYRAQLRRNKSAVERRRSSGGGSSSSSSSNSTPDLPTSNLDNITPAATVGMTEESVRRQTTVVKASSSGSSKNYSSINDFPTSNLNNPTPPATVQTRVNKAQPVYTPSYDFGMYGSGTITATPPDAKKESNINRIGEGVFNGGFWGSLFNRGQTTVTRGGTYNVDTRPFKERFPDDIRSAASLGAYAVDVWSMGAVGGAVAGAQGLRTTGAQALKTTATNIGKLPRILQYPVNIIGSAAVGLGTYKTVETGLRIRTGTPVIFSKEENKAFEAGRKAQRATTSGFGRIGFELGLGTGNKDSFYNAMRKSLQEQGISNAGAKAEAGLKTGRIRDVSVLSGNLAAGAFSEFTGQAQVKAAFAAGNKPTFWTFAKTIAPAGAGEGFTQVVLSQENVGDTRPFFKIDTVALGLPMPQSLAAKYPDINNFRLKVPTSRAIEATGGAAFGSLTSGLLGGWIGSAAAKGNKAIFPKTLGYVLDPTEYPSDVLEGVVTKGIFTNTPKVPVFTEVPSFAFSETGTPSQVQTQTKGKPKSKTPTYSFIPSFSTTPVNNLVATTTPVDVPQGRPKGRTPVNPFTNVPVNINDNVPIFPEVPVPADTTTNINIFPDSTVPTNVQTNTPVSVNPFTNVPVFTNRINAPLPLIPTLNFGGGGYGGVARKKGTRYINELAESKKIFQNIMGFKPIPIKSMKQAKPKPRPKSKSKSKKVYKEERKRTPLNRFNKMVFG